MVAGLLFYMSVVGFKVAWLVGAFLTLAGATECNVAASFEKDNQVKTGR